MKTQKRQNTWLLGLGPRSHALEKLTVLSCLPIAGGIFTQPRTSLHVAALLFSLATE